MGTQITGPAVIYTHYQVLLKYLNYYLTASNGHGHGIHSPFVYKFVREILNDKKTYPEYDQIEALRKSLLKNKQVLTVEDFGAGSSLNKKARRSIASIAKNAAKPRKLAQLLFRISRYFKPENILELGTSLGISTAYLSAGNSDAKIITCEGSSSIAKVAKENFRSLGMDNISVVEGNFDDTLPEILKQTRIDLAFVDGNHRMEPTINYFNTIKEGINQHSVIIFDDIHWSAEMENAWEIIKNDVRVTVSIDLFFLGFVFFMPDIKEPQHFKIRF